MSYRPLFLSLILLLTSCAYAIDKSIQPLTIVTPGAHDALCYVYVNKLKYKFRPPQTITISKSEDDLIIDCLAPGNRRQKLVIAPEYADTALGNMVTLGAGLAWDYASGALFKYPDVVEVDFTEILPKAMRLPAHNNPDIKQPEEYDLEEFRPGQMRLNDDKYISPIELRRRILPGAHNAGTASFSAGSVENAESAGSIEEILDKGDLMAVIKSLENEIDPALPQQESSDSVPLYPGE